MTTTEAWAVKGPDGKFRPLTISIYRDASIQKFLSISGIKWRTWYRRGWRCLRVRVRITEVPND